MGCRNVSWDLPLRSVLRFSGLAPSLVTGLLLAAVVLLQPSFVNAPRAVLILPVAVQPPLKASFISVCSVCWMPLPDHLSPLASSSGDTCGFNIMHRCVLGEGRHGCGLTHQLGSLDSEVREVVLFEWAGQEGGKAEWPADGLTLWRFLHLPWDRAQWCILHCKESVSYSSCGSHHHK